MNSKGERAASEALTTNFATDNAGSVFPSRIRRRSAPRPSCSWAGPLFYSGPLRLQKEIIRRKLILERFADLMRSGFSRAAAAQKLSVGTTTVWRWENGFREHGLAGLAPKTERCGRHPAISADKIPDWIVVAVQKLQAMGIGHERAWRIVAADPHCPAELKEFVGTRRRLPPSLLQSTRLKRQKVTQLSGSNFSMIVE